MSSLRKLLVVSAFLVPMSGCLVVEKHTRPRPHTASVGCHPSQYWDGHQCRHKGNGHGARKHDGASKGKGKSKKG